MSIIVDCPRTCLCEPFWQSCDWRLDLLPDQLQLIDQKVNINKDCCLRRIRTPQLKSSCRLWPNFHS